MCEQSPVLLVMAFIAYAHRHRNDLPFAEQWYRGCGRNPSNVRGTVRK